MTQAQTKTPLEVEVVERQDIATAREVADLPVSTQLMPVPKMQEALAEYTVRRRAFRSWLKAQFTPGVHYGYPPGCAPKTNAAGLIIDKNGYVVPAEQWTAKPSLYKAGAQMLCDLLGIRPRWEADEVAWKQLGSVTGTFVMRCELLTTGSPFFAGRSPGEVLGEGRGSFAVGEKGMNHNSAIKIAEKRALVDAILTTLGIADLFTQDVEDDTPATPRDKPDQDEDAPDAPTREERKQAKPPKERFAAIAKAFAEKHGEDREAFKQWVQQKLGLTADAKLPSDDVSLAKLEAFIGITQ